MARVTLIRDKDQLAADDQWVFDKMMQTRRGSAGPNSVLLYDPALCNLVIPLGDYLRGSTPFTRVELELAILSVAREKRAGYAWGTHVATARNAGVREEAIAAIREQRVPEGLTPEERDICTYALSLCRENRVDQALFDRLQAQHGIRWLVDLTAVVGFYQMLSAIIGAFEIGPEQGSEPLPE